MALSEFAKLAMQELASQINERNAAVGTLKASQGDKQGLIESLAVNPPADNKQAVAACNKVTELDAALNAAIEARNDLLEPIADEMLAAGKENVEALTSKVADLDKTIKAGRKYFTDLYGEDVVKDLPDVISLRGTGSSSGGGSGQRRIRNFNFWVDGTLATVKDPKTKQDRSNLAAAAKVIGVEPEDMRQAFWNAQGTQNSDEFKDHVTFEVTVGEGAEANTYKVVAEKQTTDEGSAAAAGQ